jgi:predicted nucleic acid-binding protein
LSHYIDTSAVVAMLVVEPHTPRVMAWLANRPPGTLFISEWTHTEVASALSLKLRTGALTLDVRANALATWNRLQVASLHTLGVTSAHFETAAHFANQHELGVRSGDALHLAVAAESGFTLVTLDILMANAAPRLGVPVESLPTDV